MDIKIVDLPEIAIIGKEGFCTEEANIVQNLWEQANENFDEVLEMGLKEKNGAFVGFWGAMSDETMSFMPWTNNFTRGYYLAGIEVHKDAQAPEGWKKWIMPARKYLVTEVMFEKYMETFMKVIETEISIRNMKLSGAACDYTEPSTGKNFIFFPVQDLQIYRLSSGYNLPFCVGLKTKSDAYSKADIPQNTLTSIYAQSILYMDKHLYKEVVNVTREEVAIICKAMSDSNRLRIIEMLTQGEKCGCHLLEELQVTQPTLSHHMKVLSDCGLVSSYKDGKWQHYSINCERFKEYKDYIAAITCCGTKQEVGFSEIYDMPVQIVPANN